MSSLILNPRDFPRVLSGTFLRHPFHFNAQTWASCSLPTHVDVRSALSSRVITPSWGLTNSTWRHHTCPKAPFPCTCDRALLMRTAGKSGKPTQAPSCTQSSHLSLSHTHAHLFELLAHSPSHPFTVLLTEKGQKNKKNGQKEKILTQGDKT